MIKLAANIFRGFTLTAIVLLVLSLNSHNPEYSYSSIVWGWVLISARFTWINYITFFTPTFCQVKRGSPAHEKLKRDTAARITYPNRLVVLMGWTLNVVFAILIACVGEYILSFLILVTFLFRLFIEYDNTVGLRYV